MLRPIGVIIMGAENTAAPSQGLQARQQEKGFHFPPCTAAYRHQLSCRWGVPEDMRRSRDVAQTPQKSLLVQSKEIHHSHSKNYPVRGKLFLY